MTMTQQLNPSGLSTNFHHMDWWQTCIITCGLSNKLYNSQQWMYLERLWEGRDFVRCFAWLLADSVRASCEASLLFTVIQILSIHLNLILDAVNLKVLLSFGPYDEIWWYDGLVTASTETIRMSVVTKSTWWVPDCSLEPNSIIYEGSVVFIAWDDSAKVRGGGGANGPNHHGCARRFRELTTEMKKHLHHHKWT